MPFQIPNQLAAAFPPQAQLDSGDIDILAAGYKATGVVSGCGATVTGSNMSVTIAAGVVRHLGMRVVVAGGSVTCVSQASPRFALVSVNTSGTLAITHGTAAASPAYPTLPANSVIIYAVYIEANDTAIASNQLVDKRVEILDPPFENVKWYGATGSATGDDAAAITAAMAAANARSGGVVFFPQGTYRILSQITVPVGVRVDGEHGKAGNGSAVPQLLYDGSTLAGGMVLYNITTQNLQYHPWRNVGFDANFKADHCVEFGGTGKVDFGTVVEYSAFNKSLSHAIILKNGATNFHMQDVRWDHCKGFAIYGVVGAGKNVDFLTVTRFTYDNAQATVDNTTGTAGVAPGFIGIDNSAAGGGGSKTRVRITNGRVEVNKIWKDGADPINVANDRGAFIKFITNATTNDFSQGQFLVDNVWLAGATNESQQLFHFLKVRTSANAFETGQNRVTLTLMQVIPFTQSMVQGSTNDFSFGTALATRLVPFMVHGAPETGAGRNEPFSRFFPPFFVNKLGVGAALDTGIPTVTSGTGAPSAAEPNGSIYLRSDGTSTTTLYVRAAGAWVAK